MRRKLRREEGIEEYRDDEIWKWVIRDVEYKSYTK